MRSDLQGDDPFAIWESWFAAAKAAEPNDPNAAALATATADGVPSVRMVLVKESGAGGFVFFTNAGSRKGQELESNPRAALCLHWKSLRRQVRICGEVHQVSEQVADDYFHSRSRKSQIAAAVSQQSRPLASRDVLDERFGDLSRQVEGKEVPRPAGWNGYCVHPDSIEFWMDGADRMHDRRLFERTPKGWVSTLLFP